MYMMRTAGHLIIRTGDVVMSAEQHELSPVTFGPCDEPVTVDQLMGYLHDHLLAYARVSASMSTIYRGIFIEVQYSGSPAGDFPDLLDALAAVGVTGQFECIGEDGDRWNIFLSDGTTEHRTLGAARTADKDTGELVVTLTRDEAQALLAHVNPDDAPAAVRELLEKTRLALTGAAEQSARPQRT